MAIGDVEFTKDQLFAVLKLTTTEAIDFVAADIPDATATALADAYLALQLARNNDFEPFGRKLARFANSQVPVVKAAIGEGTGEGTGETP